MAMATAVPSATKAIKRSAGAQEPDRPCAKSASVTSRPLRPILHFSVPLSLCGIAARDQHVPAGVQGLTQLVPGLEVDIRLSALGVKRSGFLSPAAAAKPQVPGANRNLGQYPTWLLSWPYDLPVPQLTHL